MITNWVNNIERWYSGFSNGTDRITVYGGVDTILTQNRVYWVNVTYDGTTQKMYIDNVLATSATGANKAGASGYLTIANYYAAGSYRPGTGVLYVNNFKIYTGTSSTFTPS